MATMAMDMAKKNRITLLLVSAFFSQATMAGEWKFIPSLVVDETYTDNVELVQGSEESSLVSQTGLNINSQYDSQLLTFSLSSSSVYAFYSHDSDLDDDFHTLDGSFDLKLGNRGFSLFGNAKLDNQARNGATNSLADIVSADTVQIENYSGGLSFALANSDFVVNSRIAYNLTESEDDIGNQEGYTTSFSTKNGSSARIIFWEAQGNYQERKNNSQTGRSYQGETKLGLITSWKLTPFLRYYDEDNKGMANSGQSTESNSYGIGVRWSVTPRLQLDLSYNKPIGNSVDLDGKELDDYLDASVEWQPSNRTQLSANFSQRFYGDTYGLSLTHKNRKLTNNISYQEDIQTLTRNNYIPVPLGSFWCPDGNTDNLNNCFAQDNSNIDFDHFQLIGLTDYQLIEDDVFSLNKTLTWSSELKLSRSTFNLSVNASNRENLETRTEDERSSINFSASRKVSGRSDINLKASYNDNLLQKGTESERQDRYRQVSIGYKKSLNRSLNFNFDMAHVNRSSDQQQFNYEEGRVTFKITKDF